MPDFTRILVSIRRFGVAALGTLLILIGLVIGPVIVFVPLGVAILAWEFPWVKRMYRRVKLTLRHWWRSRVRRPRQVDTPDKG